MPYHKHNWGISHRYNPKSYQESCYCGATRKITEIAPGKWLIEYPSGYKRTIKA